MTDARASGHEGGVHVDIVGEVDQIRQITVLAKELAERDPLPGRRCVKLVRRSVTTTTSPLRDGCSESEPSTLRSCSFFMIFRTTCLPGLFGSVKFWKALMIWLRTFS
jgi:hypothetical protein